MKPLILSCVLMSVFSTFTPAVGGETNDGKTVTLFDGSDTAHWRHDNGDAVKWKNEGGVLTIVPGSGSIVTSERFTDFEMHIEFMIHPAKRSLLNIQLNGNSGVYIQRRYEIQILDTAGADAHIAGCGAIYKRRAPDTNAARPAGEWQSYDITFNAARWEGDKKTANARITVVHNGVTIHDDVEIPNKTGAGRPEAPTPGPILLQDHGNLVSFRNITITPLNR